MSELLGLRGHLTAAFVGVSALTLALTALLLLYPLDRKLEADALTSLEQTTRTARTSFAELGRDDLEAGSPRLDHAVAQLRRETGSEVFVFDGSGRLLAQTVPAGGDRFPEVARALREHRLVAEIAHNDGVAEAHVAAPLAARPRTVLALRRSLGSVGGVHGVVRRSLVAAGLVAFAVSLVAGALLASQLVRRLCALRGAALQMAELGIAGTPPVDDGHRDEVGDLSRAFGRMQHRLAAQEQARRTFVSTASHELRTPLTSLQFMLHDAREELDGARPDIPEARDQLNRALVQTARLGKLAAELLDLSRIDAGVELLAEPVELGSLTRSVVAEFNGGGPPVELACDTPTWVSADPGAVARIARILVDNGRRHGGPDASLVVRVDRQRHAIEVSDSGRGVDPGDEERIFERFARGPATAANSGFGLGLAIGREVAREMGGDLVLVPGPRGATFRATFLPADDPTRGPP